MADFAINDASTSCKHPNQVPGQRCTVCGKIVPANPSAMPDEWKGNANNVKKNA